MPTINQLPSIDEVSGGNQIPTYYAGGGDARKMSVSLLQDYLQDNLTIPDNASEIPYNPAGTGAVARTVESKLRDVVSVKDFGAVGDGVADDSIAFANALSALGAGVRLSLSGLTIKINQQNLVSSKSNFEIDGEGGTIIAANGMTVASEKELLAFRSCTDFTVKNLTVNGNRANRTPAEVPAHNIELRSCQRFVFERVRSINAVVDGFILNTSTSTVASTFVRDGIFIECTADNCYRQGMSIINAYNIVVSGGAFTNTTGTSPQSGIDVESNAGAATPGNAYILIQGARFSGNVGRGVIASSVSTGVDIWIDGCSFDANTDGAITADATGMVISKCSFRGHTASVQGIVLFSAASPAVTASTLSDCVFSGNTTATPCIYTHSTTSGVRISGNSILDHANGNAVSLAGTNHVVSGNVIRNCGGVGIINVGVECVITQNTISAATGRGIYQVSGGANRNKIVDNFVKNIASVFGGYIQSDDSGTIIRGNVCASSTAATTTVGIFLGASSTRQIVCENVFYNLHSTQPIGFSGNAVYDHTIHSNIGGTANEARTLLSGMGVPTYTTGARPAANAVAVGQCIFNTTTLKPNWSNGTNWYNADGTTA